MPEPVAVERIPPQFTEKSSPQSVTQKIFDQPDPIPSATQSDMKEPVQADTETDRTLQKHFNNLISLQALPEIKSIDFTRNTDQTYSVEIVSADGYHLSQTLSEVDESDFADDKNKREIAKQQGTLIIRKLQLTGGNGTFDLLEHLRDIERKKNPHASPITIGIGEVNMAMLKECVDEPNYNPLGISEKMLVRNALYSLGAAADVRGRFITTPLPFNDATLATLYHEFGHIVNPNQEDHHSNFTDEGVKKIDNEIQEMELRLGNLTKAENEAGLARDQDKAISLHEQSDELHDQLHIRRNRRIAQIRVLQEQQANEQCLPSLYQDMKEAGLPSEKESRIQTIRRFSLFCHQQSRGNKARYIGSPPVDVSDIIFVETTSEEEVLFVQVFRKVLGIIESEKLHGQLAN